MFLILLLNKEQNVQRCDATADDSSNAAGNIKINFLLYRTFKINNDYPT